VLGNESILLTKSGKYVTCSKELKWSDVTVAGMKIFSTIILMGQVRKNKLKDY
jgi:hypothetical protein